ncbi:hypothetical protein N1027_06820 [Herbiconiux sp. CPCC 205763]|uniref:Uncharacterized protein n=1 Tax=Herbiconiux aconitum TaxID=2970913 RepID=A0ABT2GNP0_9MICO|nr:hypothetical protein [Herbiconiux aconitum]MCS5717845.1 hypothetical protein [Herbiconiux aconitum]
MTAPSDRDKDPNLDEYAYEHRVEDSRDPDYPDGSGTGTGGWDDAVAGADEHADNPHPDADGDVTDIDDPAAPDDPTGVIDPKAD